MRPASESDLKTEEASAKGGTRNPYDRRETIPWDEVDRHVSGLQARISRAHESAEAESVRSLQRLPTHSFHARLAAVRQVTTNKGKGTPGVV